MRIGRLLAPALLASVVGLGASAATPGQAAASPSASWTQFHYAATRSGYNPLETTLNSGNVSHLGVHWERALGDWVFGTPLVAGNRIFVLGDSGKLYALRLSNGARLWTASVGTHFVSTPAIWGNLVVVPGRNASGGFLSAYDVTSGARRWRTKVSADPYAFITAPAVYANYVYLSAGTTIYALSASTGRISWKTTVTASADGNVDGPVAVSGHGEYVVAAGNDGHVYALNAATGAIRWNVRAGGGIHRGGPAIYSGVVYVAEGRGDGPEGGGFDVCALQVSDGRLLWRSYAGDDIHVTPAAGAGMVVIGSVDEGLRAMDSATGALRWTTSYEGEVWGDPVLANGVVYVGTDTGFVVHSAATGGLLSSVDWSGTMANMASPAVVNGRVYTATGDGMVVVLGLP
jgi:outer membrane protein assembly factor BamB